MNPACSSLITCGRIFSSLEDSTLHNSLKTSFNKGIGWKDEHPSSGLSFLKVRSVFGSVSSVVVGSESVSHEVIKHSVEASQSMQFYQGPVLQNAF